MKATRIDKLLLDRGLVDTRTKAQALIMAGVVLVDEKRVEKASEKFPETATVRLKGASTELRYVGRGGLKLEAALRFDIAGLACLDIGASTGGFTTDCLPQCPTRLTQNQIVWGLRNIRVSRFQKKRTRAQTGAI
jgi:23S rRNA (cytidine1920-2'-O)/16S rRNA (cytidine1409-2'-O)-methyltransferase